MAVSRYTRRPRSLRDSQRAKVYAAEQAVYALGAAYRGEVLGSIEACERYCALIVRHPWFQQQYPGFMPIKIVHGRKGMMRAYHRYIPGYHQLVLPQWAWTTRTVLHELGHAVAHHAHGPGIPAHGPEFIERYLDLIQAVAGDAMYHAYRAAFWTAGVRVGRRTRPVVPFTSRQAALML